MKKTNERPQKPPVEQLRIADMGEWHCFRDLAVYNPPDGVLLRFHSRQSHNVYFKGSDGVFYFFRWG